jgi:hypothetical protein
MNPEYRRFFAHVWAICWPWLWWNLRRLERWQEKHGRNLLIGVDKLGNTYVLQVGDAPEPDDLYSYEVPSLMPWVRLEAGAGLPETCSDDAAPYSRSFHGVFTVFFTVPAAQIRGPPQPALHASTSLSMSAHKERTHPERSRRMNSGAQNPCPRRSSRRKPGSRATRPALRCPGPRPAPG